MLEKSICRMEYTIAKKHPLIGQSNILPTCEELPSAGSKDSVNCLRLGVPNVVQVIHGTKNRLTVTLLSFLFFLFECQFLSFIIS